MTAAESLYISREEICGTKEHGKADPCICGALREAMVVMGEGVLEMAEYSRVHVTDIRALIAELKKQP